MLCAFALLCGGRRWGGKIGRPRLLECLSKKCAYGLDKLCLPILPAHIKAARKHMLAGRCALQQG